MVQYSTLLTLLYCAYLGTAPGSTRPGSVSRKVSGTSLPLSEDAPTASSAATHQPEGPKIKYLAGDYAPAFSPELKRAYKQDRNDHKSRAGYVKQYILWKMRDARKAASDGEEYKPCSFRTVPFPRENKESRFPWSAFNPQSMPEPMPEPMTR